MALLYKSTVGYDIFYKKNSEWIRDHREDYGSYLVRVSNGQKEDRADRVLKDVLISCGAYHNFNKFYMFELDMWKRDHSKEGYKTVPFPNLPVNNLLTNHKHLFFENRHHAIYIIQHNTDLLSKIRSLRSDMFLICECK